MLTKINIYIYIKSIIKPVYVIVNMEPHVKIPIIPTVTMHANDWKRSVKL